jgi:serine/threonine-protein phosphatase 2A regulatory subunit B
MKMLTTNSRNIKLWKIFDKTEKKVVKSAGKDLNIPKLQNVDSCYTAQLQKLFPPKHLSSISSISTTDNEEYLLSSDDVQAFLWSMEDPNKPFLVADMLGREKIEDVKENINFSKLHPNTDSLFLFGTNKGTLKMCDLRLSALIDNTAVSFKTEAVGNAPKNFFTEMISSYSSATFIKSGKYIISRDFLSVKVWDICNSKKPISSITVQ